MAISPNEYTCVPGRSESIRRSSSSVSGAKSAGAFPKLQLIEIEAMSISNSMELRRQLKGSPAYLVDCANAYTRRLGNEHT